MSKHGGKKQKLQTAAKRGRQRLRWRRWAIFWSIMTVVLAVVLIGGVVYQAISAKLAEPKIPQLEISLSEVPLEIINVSGKEIKYEGNRLSLQTGGVLAEYENVRVKGRGNATWARVKKPYQIKLPEKAEFLGLNRARKFVLLANYLDDSHLRNDTALWISREILKEPYEVRGEYAELLVDDNYYGLYYVTNGVEIGKTGVDLHDSLGILVELDNIYGANEESYLTAEGDYLAVKDVVNEDLATEALTDFGRSFEVFEVAAKAKDWAAVQDLIDVESFVRYYLLSEFTVNLDAYKTSCYFYKDGPEDIIHAGPGWDFDMALGNPYMTEHGNGGWVSPLGTHNYEKYAFGWEEYDTVSGVFTSVDGDKSISRYMYYLLQMPEFQQLAAEMWKTRVEGRLAELVEHIAGTASYIWEAAERDYARWKKEDFAGNVNYLLDWVEQRYNYLSGVFAEIHAPGVTEKPIIPE